MAHNPKGHLPCVWHSWVTTSVNRLEGTNQAGKDHPSPGNARPQAALDGGSRKRPKHYGLRGAGVRGGLVKGVVLVLCPKVLLPLGRALEGHGVGQGE